MKYLIRLLFCETKLKELKTSANPPDAVSVILIFLNIFTLVFSLSPKGVRVIYYHSENIIVTTSITISLILFRKSFAGSTI